MPRTAWICRKASKRRACWGQTAGQQPPPLGTPHRRLGSGRFPRPQKRGRGLPWGQRRAGHCQVTPRGISPCPPLYGDPKPCIFRLPQSPVRSQATWCFRSGARRERQARSGFRAAGRANTPATKGTPQPGARGWRASRAGGHGWVLAQHGQVGLGGRLGGAQGKSASQRGPGCAALSWAPHPLSWAPPRPRAGPPAP